MTNAIDFSSFTFRFLITSDIAAHLDQLTDVFKQTLYVSYEQGKRSHSSDLFYIQKCHVYSVCAIVVTLTQELIGAIEVRSNTSMLEQFYLWLQEEYWHRTYFEEVIAWFLREYLSDNDRVRFIAYIDTDNTKIYHVLQKAGFVAQAMRDGLHGKQYILCYQKET